MYEKYLIKSFDPQSWDCCNLASEFLKDNFHIDMTIVDNYPRNYTQKTAKKCMLDGFGKNSFIEVFDNYKKGDVIIKENSCYICADDKVALTVRKITHIDKISKNSVHLRHKELL